MERSKINGVNAQVHGEVQPLAIRVRIAAIRTSIQPKALFENRRQPTSQCVDCLSLLTITYSHHVFRIQRLNVGTGRANPLVKDGRIAAVAAWLIG